MFRIRAPLTRSSSWLILGVRHVASHYENNIAYLLLGVPSRERRVESGFDDAEEIHLFGYGGFLTNVGI